MQPYFFPYLGYFHLISSVDLLVIYDVVQFSKGGWLNRNRILHPNKGWQYITAPLKRASYQNHIDKAIAIKSIETSETAWPQRVVNQLTHYKKAAPFYLNVIPFVHDCLFFETRFIAELNTNILVQVCDYIDIEFHYQLASQLQIDLNDDLDAEEKVLHICEHFGATQYVNLPGGRHLYNKTKFTAKGIELMFCELPPMTYDCQSYEFIPSLSIIDVLMWNTPEKVREHLEKHQ